MIFGDTRPTAISGPEHPTTDRDPKRDRSTSVELAQALAGLEVEELDRWRDELVVATADLARAAEAGWTIDASESTVALTRIVAHLARVAPTVESALAGHLIDAIAIAGIDGRDRHHRSNGWLAGSRTSRSSIGIARPSR